MSNEKNNTNVYNANDAFEINELASLNEDISPELIEQLQNKISAEASNLNQSNSKINEDANLFEEIKLNPTPKSSPKIDIDKNIDDNFIKKYKAKLNKQTNETDEEDSKSSSVNNVSDNTQTAQISNEKDIDASLSNIIEAPSSNQQIEVLSAGKITEKPVTTSQLSYNDSLDFLDNNIKYSKYVIYIDPENTDFIESLTVKERKNLINKILREQDDIAITKKRLTTFQTVLKHVIISIITIAISIPIVYITINASLEATINNHRRSQGIFKTLYKEKGKIKQRNNLY